jgi:ribosomal protein L31
LNTDLNITGIIDNPRQVTVIDSSTLRFPYSGGIAPGTTNIDTGFPSYIDNITPGSYTFQTICTQMTANLNLVKRRNGSGQYHYFTVTPNLDTNIMKIDSVITKLLPANSVATLAGSTTITISQQSHGFYTGDRITMIGIQNLAGIPGTTLSGIFNITVIDFNTFTYNVNITANATSVGGGNTVRSGKDAPLRMLFNTANTLIQYNLGYPNEDSTDAIVATNPITTKALKITNASIIGNYIRFTTTIPHGLYLSTVLTIINISVGSPVLITTSVPHGITVPTLVTIRNSNSKPKINGTFQAIPVGVNIFEITVLTTTQTGNTGQALYSGDKIKITGLATVPNITVNPSYFVENIPSANQFDVFFQTTSIDPLSINACIIGTSQVFINHPNHPFNELVSITTVNTNFANIQTKINNNLLGTRTDSVTIVDGPVNTNTVDINLSNHGLTTSDVITITNSTTNPIVDGTYNVQVVDLNTLAINFVHTSLTSGTGTILTGSKVTISYSNSLPKIDGTYNVFNKLFITSITTGTITSTITTNNTNYWNVGDQITITNSNSTPVIDGIYTIQSIVNPTSFRILLVNPVVNPGTYGLVVNNSRFQIYLGYTLTTPGAGNAGILGRNNDVVHYRIKSNIIGANNIGGIPLTVLNGTYKPIANIIDSNNYMVRTIESYATSTVTDGMSDVRVSSLHNGFRTPQYNTNTGDSSGTLFRSINLAGEFFVYLVSPGLQTVFNNSGVDDTFAKILLTQPPGAMAYSTFISSPFVFDNPLASINTMSFKILTSGGFLFNLNNINYSFSLKFTEIVNQNESDFMSSRQYNQI